ncbi:RidA family protein [Arthrobacter globiformis]|uniref:RidA family protein n=1 Tax=Arthrobacter globiformis TaxID=1665 RepID=UPI002791A796|nr:RidA family protein [Arthrobacter globiformis]MDQ0617264.1 enamine deaminase RidA (YjgF/YER057c/UK114 family) [Arthrobacter globiformis]
MNENKTSVRALPPTPQPAGNYVPVREAHGVLYTAGHTSAVQGMLEHRGRVGQDLTVEEGRSAAATAVLNCLASLAAHAGGLDRIEEIVSMTGYVCAGSDFTEHPRVMDGASEVLVSYFGDRGRPVRAAVGVSSLPDGAPVEISLLATIRSA